MKKSAEGSIIVEMVKEIFHGSPDPIKNLLQNLSECNRTQEFSYDNSGIINLPTLFVPKISFTHNSLICLLISKLST